MGLLRGIGRAAPVLAGGAAAAWYLRRRGLPQGDRRPQVAGGRWQVAEGEGPSAVQPPVPSAQSAEPEPEPDEPIEAHAQAVEAVSDASDVTSVVEDLLAVAPGEEPEIVDAEVVTEGRQDLAQSVRTALAEIAGLAPDSLEVESAGGVVWLRGELERPDAITKAERTVASVDGVIEVHNLLHLPGTPPPKG